MRQGKSHRLNQADRQEEVTDRRSPQEQAQAQRRRNRQIPQPGQPEAELNAPAQQHSQRRPRHEEEQQQEQPNPESDGNVARMPARQQREQSNSSTRRSRKRRSSGNSQGHRRNSSSQRAEFAFGGSRSRNDPAAGDQEDNLVEQYRAILDGDNVDAEERNKAQNVFVAAAGNLPMAAQLYWDDYFATQAAASGPAAANALPQPPPKNDAINMDQDSSSTDDDDDDFSREGAGRRHPHRKIRRSLDGAFRAANRDDASSSNNSNNGGDNDGAPVDAVARPPVRNAPDGDDDQEGMQEDRVENNNDNNVAGSVSVSDDESGGNQGVWRLAGKRQDSSSRRRRGTRDMERRIREAAAAVAQKVSPKIESPPQRRRKVNEANKEPKFLIPDSDWLQDHEQDGAAVRDPLLILWGKGTPAAKNSENDEDEDGGQEPQEDEEVHPVENNVEGDDADPPPAEGNVVADEEMDDDQPEQERERVQEANVRPSNTLTGIPHTWLNASFSLAECGTGVALNPPKPEDVEFFTWRQQQNQERRQSGVLPPPYHCKSMTAIFSIIQAMLLTGVSIQGDTINCTKVQTPWSELTKTQREVEFDSRLKDVLAALIFVAAEASLQQKKRSVAKAEEESRDREKDEEVEAVNEAERLQTKKRIQNMKRRLRLMTTCTWEDDPTAGMPQAPDGPSHRNVQVATSLTNIQDIDLYVSSNLRDFKAPGGVALLMETIARIHGAGVLEHMMKVSTAEGASKRIHTTSCLISCSCEQRQKIMLEENPIPNFSRIDPAKLVDTTPPGHDCTSHQLISLLLTGKIESSWKGWSSIGLGFGLLSSNHGQIGFELTRPEQPVWLLQGQTGYTVLHLTDCKGADRRTVSKLDTAGAVLEFSHWNSWYGQKKQSGLKLFTAGAKWDPRAKQTRKQENAQHPGGSGPTRTLRLLRKQRDLERSTSAKARQQESSLEANGSEISIKPEEVEAAKVHPDDERHYPGNHKMWRFDIGDLEKENSADDEDKKLRGNAWIPYYRLTARQKYVADLKLGPKIRGILWTRWPNATINGFTPINGDPPVV
ncbi:MAG: hypothetical protein SGBAC_003928 [Bacillariaceae sp.]